MWWLYLDESGDLGFDFVNKKPSKFFTICILATSSGATNRAFGYAVKKTLRRKLNRKKGKKRFITELKASQTTLQVKKYVCDLLAEEQFGIYALTLNKKKVYARLAENKERVYNYIARLVIDQIPFELADECVQLVIDRSKGKAQRREFDRYIIQQLQGRISPGVPLFIMHDDSRKWGGLQLVDMFAWGINRKYEKRDSSCLSLYKQKVLFEQQYL